MDTVIVATFSYRHEAEVARSFLEMEGVDAIIANDDAGGMQPGIMSPTRLIVRAEDEEFAREILARSQPSDE